MITLLDSPSARHAGWTGCRRMSRHRHFFNKLLYPKKILDKVPR